MLHENVALAKFCKFWNSKTGQQALFKTCTKSHTLFCSNLHYNLISIKYILKNSVELTAEFNE